MWGAGRWGGSSQGHVRMPSSVHVVTARCCLLVKLRSRMLRAPPFSSLGDVIPSRSSGGDTQKGLTSWSSSPIGRGKAQGGVSYAQGTRLESSCSRG